MAFNKVLTARENARSQSLPRKSDLSQPPKKTPHFPYLTDFPSFKQYFLSNFLVPSLFWNNADTEENMALFHGAVRKTNIKTDYYNIEIIKFCLTAPNQFFIALFCDSGLDGL